jgi:uncharacterized protein (TIGR03437 family)
MFQRSADWLTLKVMVAFFQSTLRNLLVSLALSVVGGLAALAQESFWESRAAYPLEAVGLSAAAWNGRLYAGCGVTSFTALPQIYEFDPIINRWSVETFAPFGRADRCNMVAAEGRLYFFGILRSNNGQIDNQTYEYNLTTGQWSVLPRMVTPRSGTGNAVVGRQIYAVGGNVGGQAVPTVEVFDLERRSWTLLSNMPTPREGLNVEFINGKLYAIGGKFGAQTVNFVEELDVASQQWRRLAAAPTSRTNAGSGVVNDRIIFFGGESISGTTNLVRTVDEFFPARNQWRTLSEMPSVRQSAAGVALDGRLFAIGGSLVAGGISFSSANEVLYALPPEGPQVSAKLNAASFDSIISANTIVSLFGTAIGFGRTLATTQPLPTRLENVELQISGQPVPLLFMSDRQINFIVPGSLAVGDWSLALVVRDTRYDLGTIRVEASAPAIFTTAQTGRGQAAALIAGTGRVANSERPAKRGEALEIYMTGLNRAAPQVWIGGIEARVLFAGPAPGLLGVDQVNVEVPSGAPGGGSVGLEIRAGGQLANPVTIAIE